MLRGLYNCGALTVTLAAVIAGLSLSDRTAAGICAVIAVLAFMSLSLEPTNAKTQDRDH